MSVLALDARYNGRSEEGLWVMILGYVAHFIICALRKGNGVKKGPPVSSTWFCHM